ncbi:MAG: element excision factor XisH family protein [Chitinophagales bacterium]
MARKDIIHEAVKNALIKDGWEINYDPLFVDIDGGTKTLEIDLGGEKIILAAKGIQEIAVEIKSFSSGSILNAFHTVLGQYLDYQEALREADMKRILYIAVAEASYYEIQKIAFIQRRITQFKLKLIVTDIEKEVVTKWIE